MSAEDSKSESARSHAITRGVERTPNRAMLRAVGFEDGDFEKPIIAVANGYSTITPCNAGLNRLTERAVSALRARAHDAANVRHDHGQRRHLDGHGRNEIFPRVARSDCGFHRDRLPGAVRRRAARDWRLRQKHAGRDDRDRTSQHPSIFVYGGTIKAGHYEGEDLTIVSAFEAVGQYCAGKISEDHLVEIERHACPGSGSCGGMYTANTMSSAIEAMGLALPFSSTMAADSDEVVENAGASAAALAHAVRKQILPRQLLTRKAFENAIAVLMAVGGSTNAVLASACDCSCRASEIDARRLRRESGSGCRCSAI